tara:strand:- start:1489 stop:2520 length:1032 start_codon:yes stop_codon:yes gene_type:complete
MFFFKKIKYLTIIIFFFLFLILTFLALSNENRRSIISKGLVLHDFYRIKSLTYGLQIRDFSLLSKKLDTYIEFSKKFSAGKTYMFPGIYEATELVVSRALTQDDYNQIENVLEKLLEFDNRIYKLHVWYARALSDNDYQKALKHIDIAIKISPSENEAYREALYIAQNLNDKNLANNYCKIYKESFLGGSKPLHFGTVFDSFNNQNFALNISKLKKNNLNLINSNFVLNKDINYEFILNEKTDLNGIDLYFTPINNLILKINKIDYFSKENKYSINPNNLSVTSNHSFVLEKSDETFEVLLTQMKEELLRFRHQNLERIDKLNISMEIKKSNIANSNFCKTYK